MLRDPLSDVARKERRSLLGISTIAILVGATGLIPQEIQNLGVKFAAPERNALLWVLFGVVLYYTFAFVFYAMPDYLSYKHADHLGRQTIRRQRIQAARANLKLELQTRAIENRQMLGVTAQAQEPSPQNPLASYDLSEEVDEKPWRMIGFVFPVSTLRSIFDFGLPLVIAVYAIWTLWGATHATTQPKPTPPAPTAPGPTVPQK